MFLHFSQKVITCINSSQIKHYQKFLQRLISQVEENHGRRYRDWSLKLKKITVGGRFDIGHLYRSDGWDWSHSYCHPSVPSTPTPQKMSFLLSLKNIAPTIQPFLLFNNFSYTTTKIHFTSKFSNSLHESAFYHYHFSVNILKTTRKENHISLKWFS